MSREVDLPIAEKVCSIDACAALPGFSVILKTRENIDKYCEKFEKDMLYLFDKCYRKGDPKMMHVCLILIQSIANIVVSSTNSIVLKHSWISMAAHLVSKYM